MKRTIIIMLALILVASQAQAYITPWFNVQGVLTDDSGNTLPDGDYTVLFQFWDSATGGAVKWGDTSVVTQVDGSFDVIIGDSDSVIYSEYFSSPTYLSMQIDGDSEMEPRIFITPVPTALLAKNVDPANAVISLNGQKGGMSIVGGPNVTVSTVTGIITISADAGAGGDDGDWVMDGQDVYHDAGEVLVGLSPGSPKTEIIPPLRGLEEGSRDPLSSKMMVVGQNQGIYSLMYDETVTDRKAAIFGRRFRNVQNNGSGFNLDGSNSAVTGFNDWGDSFTFGVSGYTWFDYNCTAGVLGAQANGSYWGALAYRDSNGGYWGSYTPSNAHVGGLFETRLLRVKGGANAGYVLTSDLAGNATWQAPGAAGADNDWVINGNDVTHAAGRVYIGPEPAAAKGGSATEERPLENGARIPSNAKLKVQGHNEGVYSVMEDAGALFDSRNAIFGYRKRLDRNDGSGFGVDQTNTAITGYNDYGDSYTFGMAGYTWFDFANTGGVLGSRQTGSTWGALAFMDSTLATWGMYTPNSAHVGGIFDTQRLRVKGGANAGYIMTSDASGNASWQAPGAAVADDDWTISGNNMFHSSIGAVAIGTGAPHTWGDGITATTMQVKGLFSATLALDAQGLYPNNQLHRWTMTGGSSGLQFNKSNDYASYGMTAMSVEEGAVEVKRFDGATGIRLQGDGTNELGSKLEIYSTSTSTTFATAVLDGQDNIGDEGGSLRLRNKYGVSQVLATANYNGTNVGRVITPVLEITGGSDLSEQFDIGNTSALTEPGMVVSIDPDNPGHLTLSGQAYDRRVAGVISGAGGVNTGMVMGQRGTVADGELPVALVGRVYVWADASGGAIEPGDLLTTSDRPGHAMKVTDHDQAAGAILGKAMTGLKEGQGLILTLVSLQ